MTNLKQQNSKHNHMQIFMSGKTLQMIEYETTHFPYNEL